MRPVLLVAIAFLAMGCAKETTPVAPTTLKTADEVNKVVQKGMTMDEVKKAAGGPSGEFKTGAPNADVMWTYDVPVEKPEARVQVFFQNEKVVELATIPFSAGPTEPSRG